MEGDAQHLVAFGETPWVELFSTLSPDRRHIVFAADQQGGYDLYVLDLDAGGNPMETPRRITSLPGDEFGGDWSPGGSKILFQEEASGTTKIMVVGASGQRPEVVRAPPEAFDARWSPDGRSIVFAAPRSPHSRDRDIWVMSADGTHARDIADAGPTDWWPELVTRWHEDRLHGWLRRVGCRLRRQRRRHGVDAGHPHRRLGVA